MQTLGVGIDVIEIDRIRAAVLRHPRLLARLFTEEERRYCEQSGVPYPHYATRFAAKEAVAKSLGSGIRGMAWKDIEIINDALGKPTVRLVGGAARLAAALGVGDIMLSLSSSREHAAAVALATAAVLSVADRGPGTGDR